MIRLTETTRLAPATVRGVPVHLQPAVAVVQVAARPLPTILGGPSRGTGDPLMRSFHNTHGPRSCRPPRSIVRPAPRRQRRPRETAVFTEHRLSLIRFGEVNTYRDMLIAPAWNDTAFRAADPAA